MSEKLVDLLYQEEQLRNKLSKVTAAIREEQLLEAKNKYGVEIGGIVKDRKGKEYCITKVDVQSWGSPPWLEGNPRKKDGTFGTAHRLLFNGWEVIAPPEEVKP